MSTYGKRTRDFLRVEFGWCEVSEDYEPPTGRTWRLYVNGWSVEVLPRRASMRGYWSCRDGVVSTPWFFATVGVEDENFTDPYVSGDFPEKG